MLCHCFIHLLIWLYCSHEFANWIADDIYKYIWYDIISSYIVISFCVLLRSDFWTTRTTTNLTFYLCMYQFFQWFNNNFQSWNGILHILHVNFFLQLYIWLWDFFLYTKHKLQPEHVYVLLKNDNVQFTYQLL